MREHLWKFCEDFAWAFLVFSVMIIVICLIGKSPPVGTGFDMLFWGISAASLTHAILQLNNRLKK